MTSPTETGGIVERVAQFLEPDIMAHVGNDWEWRQCQERNYAARLLEETGVSALIEQQAATIAKLQGLIRKHITFAGRKFPQSVADEARTALKDRAHASMSGESKGAEG